MKGQALIDWFTFSVKEQVEPDVVITEYLHMDPVLFQNSPSGGLGYQRSKEYNCIKVFYEPCSEKETGRQKVEMGICVSMSGQGCRAFEAHTRYKCNGTPFWSLVEKLHADPLVNVSRVDLAVDDREELLDLDVIAEAVRTQQVNSRIRKRRIIDAYDTADRDGMSVYFGAPQSAFRIRIYDKAKEHYEPDQPEFTQHWVRFEMVFKSASANGLVACMANSNNLGVMAAGILNDKLSFIERDDINISRCSECQWWREFLESFEAIELVVGEEVFHDIDEKYDWLLHQVAPVLSLIRDAKGIPAILGLIKDGFERRSNKQSALLEDYRRGKAAFAADRIDALSFVESINCSRAASADV